MRAHEIQRKAKNLPIPTNDKEVKMRLRELGHPICLFGENAGDRRERLREKVIEYYIEKNEPPVFLQKITTSADSGASAGASSNETFYTEGCEELKEARLMIAKFSLPRAQRRLEYERFLRADVEKQMAEDRETENYLNSIGNYEVKESQYGDERAVSRGCIAPNEEFFATSGWSGTCKVWGVPDCEIRTELRGHTDRATSIKFHPHSTITLPEDGPNLATSSADFTVRLWSLNPEYEFQKSIVLNGHEDCVNQVDFHPLGKHIASTSNDKTWRLWDIESKKQLLI